MMSTITTAANKFTVNPCVGFKDGQCREGMEFYKVRYQYYYRYYYIDNSNTIKLQSMNNVLYYFK